MRADNSSMSVSDVRRRFDDLLPSLRDRQLVFGRLLDSVAHCEQLGSLAWSLTLLDNGFRLNVGQVEAMTCALSRSSVTEAGYEKDVTFVEWRLLLAGADCVERAKTLRGAADFSEMGYASVGAPHWCYTGRYLARDGGVDDGARAAVENDVLQLSENHHAFLKLAAVTSTGKLRQRSNFSQHHCEALYLFAQSVMTQPDSFGMEPLIRMRLEKAAADCGFERTPEHLGGELILRSAQFPETVTVALSGEDVFLLRASVPALLPGGATGAAGISVHGWGQLYERLQRAAGIGRTLPDRVAHRFQAATAAMPKSTEAERWVVQRVGQDMFRGALLDYWQSRCCVTGLAVTQLLRASHIKPWASCSTDAERLDVFNGLLLAPHLDALFDAGLMTFAPDGQAVWSPALSDSARDILGVSDIAKLEGLQPQHETYLTFHRTVVFRREARC